MIARLLSATAALGLLAGPVAIACSTSGTRNPSFASSPSGLEAPRALAPAGVIGRSGLCRCACDRDREWSLDCSWLFLFRSIAIES